MAQIGHRRRTLMKGLLLAASSGVVRAAFAAATSQEASRAAKLQRGEAALMRGDAEEAMRAFEQAGALGHDPEIELGLVRSAMQAGRYRQALGFAAHTAGEHAQDAACLAMYLWLLRLGGQDDFARQVWSQASQFQWPDADRQLLQTLREAWADDWPQARGGLRRPPLRLAPFAHGQPLPSAARVVSSGALLCDEQGVQLAVIPASVLPSTSPQRWWVRNGLGLTVGARLHAAAPGGQVAALRLDAVMPGPATLAPRDAFPGSPAYAFAYALGQDLGDSPTTPSEAALALAAWPLMHMGFAGQAHPPWGRLLGVDITAGSNPLGGPVFDAQGRLTGMSLAAPGAPNRLVPGSVLRQQGWVASAGSSDPAVPRQSPDALYEQGLSSTLQVILLP